MPQLSRYVSIQPNEKFRKLLQSWRSRSLAPTESPFSNFATWINVWKSWAESKGLNDDIVKYEAKELDECLSRFFAEIRKNDGSARLWARQPKSYFM